MQFSIAFSALLAAAAATAASILRDTATTSVNDIVQGLFESHLGDAGITLVAADTDLSARSKVLSTRAITTVYVCTDSNFKAACQTENVTTGRCFNFQGTFQDSISSLGPPVGTTCTLYVDSNCGGGALGGIIYPGIYNLMDYNFNDKASSVKCY